MGDGQHSNSAGGSPGGMGQEDSSSNDGRLSDDDSMPDMSSARGDDDDGEITPFAFPSVAVGAFAPPDDDGAPEEKSGEPVSGGIPIDMPAPILKDVPVSRPSPDGIDSSMSRSVSSFKAIQITKVYKAQ